MCDIGVIDTGVLLGFVIKQDQHHKTSRDYIVNGNQDTLYLPPRAETEFSNAEPYIRDELKKEIRNHRNEVISEMSQDQLDNNAIQYVRDAVLDEDDQSRAHAFLYRYYTQKYKQPGTLIKSNLLQDLSNMEYEVQQDQSSNYGGWQTHVDTWNKETGTYPKLRRNLLVPTSTDLCILIDGHHIAVTESHAEFEFATANPSDFIKHYPKEPCSRDDDICNRTDFCNIRNLVDSLDRHYPN